MDTADFEQYPLGTHAERIALEDASGFRAAALSLVAQAKRQVHIFSHDLDGPLYNNEAFLSALTQVAHAHRSSAVFILVQDTSPAISQGHRLLGLAQQFSTDVRLRKVSEDYQNRRESFLIADQQGLLYRNESDRYQGFVNFSAPQEAGRQLRFFEEVWERSGEISDIRRLFL